MTSSKDEQIRAAVAEQAAEWFVANDEGPLDARESAELVAWLKASPVHVEEFLRVAVIARDLGAAAAGLESAEALIARTHAEDASPVQRYWPQARAAVRTLTGPRWQTTAVAMAAIGVVSLGLFLFSKPGPVTHVSTPTGITALHFATHHGEQQTQRLADNSVLHLNTDTAITIRYSKTERLVVLESGEADFKVAHESDRAFRVVAGPAQAIAHGTQFDVRLKGDSAVVTVIEGRVGVAPSRTSQGTGSGGAIAKPDDIRFADNLGHEQVLRFVELHANEQISVSKNSWPVAPTSVDVHRATAWLHRQIAFDHESLEQVAAEFNRYAPKPIEITTPELRKLEISGIFSTDDSEEFLAFLGSLGGVRVDVTETRIRVSQK
jgi:transmembrane sensor